MEIANIVVTNSDVDLKIEKFLLKKYTNLNYILLQKLIRTGQIRVNKSRVKQGYVLKLGDTIRIPNLINNNVISSSKSNILEQRLSPSAKIMLEAVQQSILYQDEHILIINKPSGLAVQGGSKVNVHLDLLLPYLLENNPDKLRLVHRLDKETSGVLILAKTASGAKYLFNQFKDRQIKKVYHCLVEGIPKANSGVINRRLLKEDKQVKVLQQSDDFGKEAVTKYSVLKVSNNFSYLEAIPETGRTHQIRAHLGLDLNTPIVGDYKYGYKNISSANFKFPQSKIFLHARAIYFKNLNHKNLIIEANYDDVWQKALTQLQFI